MNKLRIFYNYMPNLYQYKRIGHVFSMGFMLAVLWGCSNMQAPNPMSLDNVEQTVVEGPNEFMKLQTLSRPQGVVVVPGQAGAITNLRLQSVTETAMSVGARSALAWRAVEINRMLEERKPYLDGVFNFQGLLLEKEILPPILLESRNDVSMDGPQGIRIADRTYRILRQAQFVTVAPSWREYLIMKEQQPDPPDVGMLPATGDEKVAWQKGIVEGWAEGVKQANLIYEENLARLKRDYQGMVRYRMLLAQNMVSAPLTAQRDLGITGGGEQLSVNDRILTIKALPSLKADSKNWTPSVAP
jgi:defect-in-organelle-trafficking protein DotC